MKIKLLGGCVLFVALCLSGCSTSDSFDAFQSVAPATLLADAETAIYHHNYDAAVTRLEALDAAYPFGSYTERGQLNLIYAYYQKDDIASALAAADRYIRLYPRSKNVDYAYFMKGMVNMDRRTDWMMSRFALDPARRDLSNLKEAFADFTILLRRFPKSRYAGDAHQRMYFVRNVMAKHELEVAQFYYDQHAYLAAVNRASYLVTHFQGVPQLKAALTLMVSGYQKLGETKLATDTQKVLDYNFPEKTAVS